MTMRRPSCAQRFERRGGRRLDRIGDGDHARRSLPSTRRSMTVAPVRAAVGLGVEPRHVDAVLRQEARRCRAAGACPRPCPTRPCPAGESKLGDRRRRDARARARPPRSPRRADARCRARGWRRAAAARLRRARRGTIAVTSGLPSVSVPVLSTTSVSTFSSRSSASALRISTPGRGAAADADHDRHRRGQARARRGRR